MSGWATTYTWRCDAVDTSNSPQALRVSRPNSITITIIKDDEYKNWLSFHWVTNLKSLSLLDGPSGVAVLVLQDYWADGHSKFTYSDAMVYKMCLNVQF